MLQLLFPNLCFDKMDDLNNLQFLNYDNELLPADNVDLHLGEFPAFSVHFVSVFYKPATGPIKYWYVRFPNGCIKLGIELRVVHVWSEIIIVISNRTRAASSFDFEVSKSKERACMISDLIALLSVQLLL